MTALEMIEHLIGLQAQAPFPPYTGLWTRVDGFAFDDLAALLTDRSAVRILTMRATVHLMSARDACGIRPVVQSVLEREFTSVRGKALAAAGVDVDAVVERCRRLLLEEPMTAKQLVDITHEDWLDAPREHVSAVPRIRLPLVQLPPRGIWGQSGQPTYALLDDWTGLPLEPYPRSEIVKRYLAAFGPATVKDAQAWCGLTRLKEVFDELGDELVVLEGPSGEMLYDLPDAPRPAADTPAPVRILPEWDNLLLSHADRTRVIDHDRREALWTRNGIVASTVLVDGRVSAVCKVDSDKSGVRLRVRPYERLTKLVAGEITAEGEALLAAMGGTFAAGEVTLETAGSAWNPTWD